MTLATPLRPPAESPAVGSYRRNALGPAEPRFFLEEHFGRKIKDQHRVMIRQMIDLAASKGLPHVALDELATRLSAG